MAVEAIACLHQLESRIFTGGILRPRQLSNVHRNPGRGIEIDLRKILFVRQIEVVCSVFGIVDDDFIGHRFTGVKEMSNLSKLDRRFVITHYHRDGGPRFCAAIITYCQLDAINARIFERDRGTCFCRKQGSACCLRIG